MIYLVIGILVIAVLIVAVEIPVRKGKSDEKLRQSMLNRYQRARVARQNWKRKNSNFDHPGYQELWDLEIAAEAWLRVNFPDFIELSWREYCIERKSASASPQ